MKINYPKLRPFNAPVFAQLSPGDAFLHNTEVYLKLRPVEHSPLNGVNLSTGVAYQFSQDHITPRANVEVVFITE